jgi:hypothetical protein
MFFCASGNYCPPFFSFLKYLSAISAACVSELAFDAGDTIVPCPPRKSGAPDFFNEAK